MRVQGGIGSLYNQAGGQRRNDVYARAVWYRGSEEASKKA
jgi:hypothetical protein